MNFLQLCQKVHRILRIDERDPGSLPSAVASQTGILGEIVNFVQDSYRTIQALRPDWLFRMGSANISLDEFSLAGKLTPSDYNAFIGSSVVEHFLHYHGQCGRTLSYDTGSGTAKAPLHFIPYQNFSGVWDLAPLRTGYPSVYTITPDGGIQLDSAPNGYNGSVYFDYRKPIVALTGDTGAPIVPEQHHDAIVWGAVVQYCNTRDQPELMKKAQREYAREMTRLHNEQLPEFSL